MTEKRIGLLLAVLLLAGAAVMTWNHVHPRSDPVAFDEELLRGEIQEARREVEQLSRESSQLSRRLARFSEGRVVVVDTAKNRLYLLSGSKTLLDAPCSTGTGFELNDPVDGTSWVFKTPRGEFRILSKLVNPVWRKPDWAFVEEGKRPPEDLALRFEAGVLGDYALAFGDGYFIHGTLYARSLGQNVTHGCVRLGDRDLERLFSQARVGTPVVIF